MSVKHNEVVVTGMGVVSCLGSSLEVFTSALFSGRSGIKDIRRNMVSDKFPISYAGVVDRSCAELSSIYKEYPGIRTSSVFALAAAQEALSKSKLEPGHSIDGIVFGCAEGIDFKTAKNAFTTPKPSHCSLRQFRPETMLENLANLIASKGHSSLSEYELIPINSACASGNQAIGIALSKLREGRWKRALVGAADARLFPNIFLNFHMLGVLCAKGINAEKASSPFSKGRSGFVRAEGAAVLILESMAEASSRKAPILAKVSGYGNNSDGYRLTDGREDVLATSAVMNSAILDANLSLNEIDVISAHGTSTELNDVLETKAIKNVFGIRAYSIPVTALKSQIGHATVAAGALQAISCILMLRNQKIAPTINLDENDPFCDLDYVPNESRSVKIDTILSNNFGFGGQNASVIFQRFK